VLGVLLTVLGLVGLGAWCFAVWSFFRIISLVPAGQRLGAMFTMGWWQFDKIKALAGDEAIPHVRNYLRSFVAFFAVVIGVAGLSILLGMERQDGAGATAATPAVAQ
jgi:hypothetical protein